MKDIMNQLQVEYRPSEHQGAIIWLKNAPDTPSWKSNQCVQEDHHCYQANNKKEVYAMSNRLAKVASYS